MTGALEEGFAALEGGDHPHPPRVHVPRERRGEPRAEHLLGADGVDHLGAEHEHVGVVVAAGDLRVPDVGTQAGADPLDLVAGDDLALPAAADDDAAVDAAGRDASARVLAQRWVIDRFVTVGAAVIDLVALRRSTSISRALRSTPLWSAAMAMRMSGPPQATTSRVPGANTSSSRGSLSRIFWSTAARTSFSSTCRFGSIP